MTNYYALTVTTTSQKPVSEVAYNRSLDRYEKTYNVLIHPRCFEIAPKTRKRHCHCLVTQKDGLIIKDFIGQKNHMIDFKPVHDRNGWLAYCKKGQVKQRLV